MDGLYISEIGLGLLYLDKDQGAQEERGKKQPQKHEFLKPPSQFWWGNFQVSVDHIDRLTAYCSGHRENGKVHCYNQAPYGPPQKQHKQGL